MEKSIVNKLKKFVAKSNGWKRLWFVLSVFGLLYMAFINPFVLTKDGNLSRHQYKLAVEKDLKDPECLPFSTKPLAELKEPEYQGTEGNKGCYHIYNYRKYHNPTKVPYTSADLNSDFMREYWSRMFTLSGISSVVAIALSVLGYFLGSVTAWIVGGFNRLLKYYRIS